jgi:hypothetical protein
VSLDGHGWQCKAERRASAYAIPLALQIFPPCTATMCLTDTVPIKRRCQASLN